MQKRVLVRVLVLIELLDRTEPVTKVLNTYAAHIEQQDRLSLVLALGAVGQHDFTELFPSKLLRLIHDDVTVIRRPKPAFDVLQRFRVAEV